MFTIGDTLEIQRYKYIESKITEKDIMQDSPSGRYNDYRYICM